MSESLERTGREMRIYEINTVVRDRRMELASGGSTMTQQTWENDGMYGRRSRGICKIMAER